MDPSHLKFDGEFKKALLWESGKVVLNKEVYAKYKSGDPEKEREALQVIIHEIIEGLLQVIKDEDLSRYSSIKKIALNHLADTYFKTDEADKIYRDASDPNKLTVIFEWDSLENAKKYASSPELKAAMERAGVEGKPSIYFLKEA